MPMRDASCGSFSTYRLNNTSRYGRCAVVGHGAVHFLVQ